MGSLNKSLMQIVGGRGVCFGVVTFLATTSVSLAQLTIPQLPPTVAAPAPIKRPTPITSSVTSNNQAPTARAVPSARPMMGGPALNAVGTNGMPNAARFSAAQHSVTVAPNPSIRTPNSVFRTASLAKPIGKMNSTNVRPSQSLHLQHASNAQGDAGGIFSDRHSPNVQTILRPEYKLSVVHRHSQLVLTKRNVRRIAVTDSQICNYVQYSPTELAIVGLGVGTTDLMIWFEGQETPAIYEVKVSQNGNLEELRRSQLGRLEHRIAELFPNSRVHLTAIGHQVVVKGQAFDSEEASQILQIVRSEIVRSYSDIQDQQLRSGQLNAKDQQVSQDIVVNMLAVPGEFNVKMRVVIAEVRRSQLRNAGMNWDSVLSRGRHRTAGAGTTLSGIFENGEIDVLLKWLAANGTATLLAEPTIVCISGHSASLLAGGEFAVPTTLGLGGGQTTSFRGVGTSMKVTPTVIDRDLIRLQIAPEFSSIDDDSTVNGIPGTSVKRLQTTVELREGQTLALGGLISRQTSTQVNRIPVLGDLPYVGSRLFHKKNSSEDEVELLVLVSPEIVRPMDSGEVPPTPNYYITHPNDHDLYRYGRTEGNPDLNVYQLPPFGTGQNRGVPSTYHMQHLGTLPQQSGPVLNSHSVVQPPTSALVPHQVGPGTVLGPLPSDGAPFSTGAVSEFPKKLLPNQPFGGQQSSNRPGQVQQPPGQQLPRLSFPGQFDGQLPAAESRSQAIPTNPSAAQPANGLQSIPQQTSWRQRSALRPTTGVISDQTIQPASYDRRRR